MKSTWQYLLMSTHVGKQLRHAGSLCLLPVLFRQVMQWCMKKSIHSIPHSLSKVMSNLHRSHVPHYKSSLLVSRAHHQYAQEMHKKALKTQGCSWAGAELSGRSLARHAQGPGSKPQNKSNKTQWSHLIWPLAMQGPKLGQPCQHS